FHGLDFYVLVRQLRRVDDIKGCLPQDEFHGRVAPTLRPESADELARCRRRISLLVRALDRIADAFAADPRGAHPHFSIAHLDRSADRRGTCDTTRPATASTSARIRGRRRRPATRR